MAGCLPRNDRNKLLLEVDTMRVIFMKRFPAGAYLIVGTMELIASFLGAGPATLALLVMGMITVGAGALLWVAKRPRD
jgi:hypothetical protein